MLMRISLRFYMRLALVDQWNKRSVIVAKDARGFLGLFCKSQIFRMEGLGLSSKQLISN